ncbi:type IV pili methyl-accepting chemotaxis transducer N-terminal domain-containing protein [Marinoscillum sp. 108]|uniref:type IV pili methyl-accepting chemotaxis transducer N-terminal domain-containing protein n=1 Tax=Marinoscillum sp. 108 TaxID=2653151 RepID=UPI0012F229ED|nr:type IV pili methyl-accepting chemotaxis transducer N-terminal domain-containing protein [Marinoscillum sp. 108]VXD13990.1 PilJ/NarX-like methyl-accepting chemotaxis transducer [Marinoscillum sp. 108]
MKKYTSKYLSVLGILTLVILGSQILMQQTISGSESDSRIINISGRQRMLSQKITKASLKLKAAENEREFSVAKTELREAYELWVQSHHDLQFGSKEINIIEMNGNEDLTILFKDIEPHFQTIKEASGILIGMRYEDMSNPDKFSIIRQSITEITATEATFLNLMNQITFQYDKQAHAKITKLSTTEYYLLGCTLILILLEIFFIFRPILMDAKRKESLISELSILRADEQSFSSEQIGLANRRIKELRKVALQLKEELTEKHKAYTLKTTDQMMENLRLKAALEEYQATSKKTSSFASR